MLRKMDLIKRRWFILAAACLSNLCIGTVYAWSVFAGPMAEYLSSVSGKEVTSLALAFTLANAIGPVTIISGGFIQKKIGPRLLIMIGGILYGAGLVLSGFSKSAPMLIFSYGIVAGIGLGFVYGCTISNSVKFFPDKKGFAGGMATAFYGLSSVILPPIANALIVKFTVNGAFRILGIITAVIIVICSFFMCSCPEGFTASTENKDLKKNSDQVKAPVNVKDKNWKEMLQTPVFYLMMLMLCCGAFSGLMVTSHASGMAQLLLQLSPASAAIIVSLLALFNAAGRVLSGTLSDKLGETKTLRLVFIALIIGMVLLFMPIPNRNIPFYIGIMITGFCFGSIMGIFPGFTAAQFGMKNNGTNYGIMFCGFAIAALVGPMISSSLLQASGSYQSSFLLSGALAILGFILTFVRLKK